MKFISSSLFLAIMALASASVSTAQDATETAVPEVPGSSGCSEDACWASCIVEDEEGKKNQPDPSTAWEEGWNWCWLRQSLPGFASCDEGCTANKHVMWCDQEVVNACSPH